MPPTKFDWEPFRDEIEDLRRKGHSSPAILTSLQDSHSIAQSLTSLKRQIDWWGDLNPKYTITKDETLIDFIREEWLNNSTHKEILHAIERMLALNLPHILTSRQLKTL